MLRTNPDKIMATLHTYTSPSGKSFPVIQLDKQDGKVICLPIGHMALAIPPERLTLGVVLA